MFDTENCNIVEMCVIFFQTFLSELYVYLIDQMHESLTKTLALEDQAPVPAPLTDSAQLKHFAREAEVNGNFELATKYYQEVFIYSFCYTLCLSLIWCTSLF